MGTRLRSRQSILGERRMEWVVHPLRWRRSSAESAGNYPLSQRERSGLAYGNGLQYLDNRFRDYELAVGLFVRDVRWDHSRLVDVRSFDRTHRGKQFRQQSQLQRPGCHQQEAGE